MEVSELILWKSLGEYFCNLLINRVLLHNVGPVMHQILDRVHVYLYMLGPLPSNRIFGYLNSTFIFTKYDSGKITTKIKI